MDTNNIILVKDKSFNQANSYNPDTPDNKCDHLSVLCFSGKRDVVVENCVIDGQSARWGSKASNGFNHTYNNCIFKNATARSFDMVRGGNITFNNCRFENDGSRKKITSPYAIAEQCDIGMKGGIRDVTFNDCVLNDILIGDYSIYDQADRPKARRFTFNNCKNLDGGAIIIRGKYFEKNSLVLNNTKAKVWIWPELLTKLYWAYNRKFGDTRKFDGWNVITDEEKL
jgi:hypothetical protein